MGGSPFFLFREKHVIPMLKIFLLIAIKEHSVLYAYHCIP